MLQEFRVNTYQAQWQRHPDVARLADGGFVIVWDSFFFENGFDVYYIAVQRYDAAGNRVGGEQIVSDLSLQARYPRVSALEDGGYAVSWEAAPESILEESDVFTASFDADGTDRGAPVRVNPVSNDNVYAAETIATGTGYVSIYTANEGPGLGNGVWLRPFDSDGNPTGDVVKINEAFPRNESNARAELLTTGDVIVLWDSQRVESSVLNDVVVGRIYAPTGRPRGPEFLITDDGDGANSGADLTETSMSVAALQQGRFVSTFYRVEQIGGDAVFLMLGRIFDRTGQPETPEFLVTIDADSVIRHSTVAALPGGGFVVAWDVWSVSNTSGDFTDVYAQVFNEFGQAVGDPITVANNLAGDQEWPSITGLSGGRFVVTYESESIDNDNDGIAARIFGVDPDANLNGLTREGTPAADQLVGDFGDDILTGRGGRDTLTGLQGKDALKGGGGNDVLQGNGGIDTLEGGNGRDTLTGGAARDLLKGGNGEDHLLGGKGGDTLVGGSGADQLAGGSGGDTLNGSAGRDLLKGQGGDDKLVGAAGSDTLTGGTGSDVFVFGPGTGADRITDFAVGTDVIDLSAILGINTFGQLRAATVNTDAGARVTFDGGSLLLEGVREGALSGSDFLF